MSNALPASPPPPPDDADLPEELAAAPSLQPRDSPPTSGFWHHVGATVQHVITDPQREGLFRLLLLLAVLAALVIALHGAGVPIGIPISPAATTWMG